MINNFRVINDHKIGNMKNCDTSKSEGD